MRIGTPGFIGARLTEAREARGIAQTELGELTGIKPQSICHYEQGRQSPSPEALTLLSEKLLLPERYFLRAVPPQQQEPVFPCLRSASRLERVKAEHRLGWLSELTRYVGEYVELPPLRLPGAPPLAPESLSADDIESAATAARAHFLQGAGPIPGMTTLLENHGCIVTTWPAAECGCGGFLQIRDSVPYLALSMAGHHPSQTQVSAAHALGHLILHRKLTTAQRNDGQPHELLEHQADHFARAFLLPARSFGKEVWAPTIDALLALKRVWNCPVGVMVKRCGDLGVFDPEQVRRAFTNIGRRGWKSDEPLEHETHALPEGLLARSLRLLVDSGIKDGHTLLAEMALSAADIEDLTGLPTGYLRDGEALIPVAPRLRQTA